MSRCYQVMQTATRYRELLAVYYNRESSILSGCANSQGITIRNGENVHFSLSKFEI